MAQRRRSVFVKHARYERAHARALSLTRVFISQKYLIFVGHAAYDSLGRLEKCKLSLSVVTPPANTEPAKQVYQDMAIKLAFNPRAEMGV